MKDDFTDKRMAEEPAGGRRPSGRRNSGCFTAGVIIILGAAILGNAFLIPVMLIICLACGSWDPLLHLFGENPIGAVITTIACIIIWIAVPIFTSKLIRKRRQNINARKNPPNPEDIGK